MRYNVRNLKELQEAAAEMSSQDRLVLFTDEGPFRFRIEDGGIEKHECTESGDSLNG